MAEKDWKAHYDDDDWKHDDDGKHGDNWKHDGDDDGDDQMLLQELKWKHDDDDD